VWRRSSVDGPASVPASGGLTFGVEVSDIKSLCRRGAQRGKLA
jgi:hypothetical protein